MNHYDENGSLFALFPLGVFLVLYLGAGILLGDFYAMPVLVAFSCSAVVAVGMNRKASLDEKLEVFCSGAGESNIVLMCLIFLMAGAFSATAKAMGGVDTTVNLALSLLPEQLLLPGLFLVGCFISIAMGTSMGTIVALAPIGVGISDKTGLYLPLVMGAIVGGAMFGDNLSMISDTTIAAVRTQGCRMKDKFIMNFSIVLPAAIISIGIYCFLGGGTAPLAGDHPYDLVRIVPYVFVLLAALSGINVMLVLLGGTVLAGITGLILGSFSPFELANTVGQGMMGMAELALIALVVGGIVAMISYNGGIAFVLNAVTRRISSKKGAELGIASLVSLVDICTAYNTIAIVITGPLASKISERYDISPRRSASIMDLFSCVFQGLLPYGAQLLAAAGIARVSPLVIVPYSFYSMLIAVCGLIAIATGCPKKSFFSKRATVSD